MIVPVGTGMTGMRRLSALRDKRKPVTQLHPKSRLARRLKTASRRASTVMFAGFQDLPLLAQSRNEGSAAALGKSIPVGERTAIERALQEVWSEPKPQPSPPRHPGIALSTRQREVMDRVVEGHNNKSIAHSLGISQRTVEYHRAAVMKRTGAKSLPELTRFALG